MKPKDKHHSNFYNLDTIFSLENVQDAKKDLRQFEHCVLYTEYSEVMGYQPHHFREDRMKKLSNVLVTSAVCLMATGAAYADIKVGFIGMPLEGTDSLVAAVGVPRFVPGEWIKPGAVVIDVGINRVPAPERGEGKFRLTGDVDYDSAAAVAGAITPVPGGVGPMTIACLLRNTLVAAARRFDAGPIDI